MDLLNSKRLFLLTFVVALFSYSFVFGLDITNEVNGSCVYDGDSVTLSATVEPPEEVNSVQQKSVAIFHPPFSRKGGMFWRRAAFVRAAIVFSAFFA